MSESGSGLAATTDAAAVTLAPWVMPAVRGAKGLAKVGRTGLAEHLAYRHNRRLIGWRRDERYEFRVPYRTHPKLDIDVHPDDAAALATLGGKRLVKALEKGTYDATLPVSRFDRHLILIGSAECEPLTQLAFGYRRRLGQSGLTYEGGTFYPPIRWHEDPTAVREFCKRRLPGGEVVERPNFPIIVQTRSGEKHYVPETDADHFLMTDFLLITKVPNFLSAEALHRGRAIISVGGVHGTGTRAVSLVNKRRILSRISATLQEADSYQVLVEIDKIAHFPKHGSLPASVRIAHVLSLERSWDDWLAAHDHVKAEYTSWVLERHPFNRINPTDRR